MKRTVLLSLLIIIVSPTVQGQTPALNKYYQEKIRSTVSLGKSLAETNEYEEAVKSYTEAIDLADKRKDDGDAAFYVSDRSIYDVLTVYYYSRGDKNQARSFLESFIGFNEVFLKEYLNKGGIDVLQYNTQTIIRYLSVISMAINGNDFEYALKYAQLAEEMGAKSLGEDNSNYALILDVLAVNLDRCGEYQTALEYSLKSLSIQEQKAGEMTSAYATTLDNISTIYNDLGQYTDALEYSLKALAIRKSIEGENSENYITSVHNTGTCYLYLGDFKKGLEFLNKAKELTERTAGKDNNAYASSLNNIASAYMSMGDFFSAKDILCEVLDLRKRLIGEKSMDYITSLGNLAICYSEIGDYAKAIEADRRILTALEEIFGRQHPQYAITLNNMAICYEAIGDPERALHYHIEASEIRKSTLGENHPYYASDLNNIGLCMRRMGNHDKALEYYLKALSIVEGLYGSAHPLYSQILSNIPPPYFDKQDFENAYAYCIKAKEAVESNLGKNHPNYANVLSNIGQYHLIKGEYSDAINNYLEALLIKRKAYGDYNPDVEDCLYLLAGLYFNQEEPQKAEEYFAQSQLCMQQMVTRVFSTVGERQRELFWRKYGSYYPIGIYSYAKAINTGGMNGVAYDCALMSKGLLMNTEISMRTLIQESGDQASIDLYDEILHNKGLFDKLQQSETPDLSALNSLSESIENKERELAKRCSVYGDYTHAIKSKWTDVRSALGPNDLSIEFVSYDMADTTRYLALTLRNSYDKPHLINLFTNKELERISPKAYYKSDELTKLIWNKLQDELAGIKEIYFSASGELNNIAIESLMSIDGENRLADTYKFHRLSSTRNIPLLRSKAKNENAVLYGGIRYDIITPSYSETTQINEDLLVLPYTEQTSVLQHYRGGVDYLPNTKTEVNNIASLLQRHRIKTAVYTAEKGTEESFKKLSGTPISVIHIATHGFYWTEREFERRIETVPLHSLRGQNPQNLLHEDKALSRSGLLFAGAERTLKGTDMASSFNDGVLSAKEIAHMDLRRTNLVVLSACQSALGELTGDGILGLQRGFKKAGVQTLVMTLWEVDDEATRLFMEQFYGELTKGKSKLDAFNHAQGYLQRYNNGGHDYSDPHYWAAFIMLD